jgi:hypothetical protein
VAIVYTIVVCVPSFDFIKIYLYIVYIYESKKIRNDTKELLFRDKRKHIILNYKVRFKGVILELRNEGVAGRGGKGELSL